MSDGQVRIDTRISSSSIDSDLNALKTKLEKSGDILNKVWAGAGAVAIGALGNAFISATSRIEDMTAAFTPLTGSAEDAKVMIAALNKEAATTPFTLEDIGATAKQLLPVLGNDVEKVTKTFRMLGDTAGGNAQKLDSIARGYAKVLNTGKVSMEALNMISDAGVPIQSQLAKSMGITVEEMYKLSSQGKITSDQLTTTFQDMTKEGGIFFDGMNVASQTFSGKMSTMQDNLNAAGAVIGNMMLPAMKKLVDSVSIAAGDFTEWAGTNKNLENTINNLTFALTTAALTIGAFAVAANISKILYATEIAVLTLRVAMIDLNAALVANPIGLVAAGLIAAGAALVYVNGEMEKLENSKALEKFGTIADDTARSDAELQKFAENTRAIDEALASMGDSIEKQITPQKFRELAKTVGMSTDELARVIEATDKAGPRLKEVASGFVDSQRQANELFQQQQKNWKALNEYWSNWQKAHGIVNETVTTTVNLFDLQDELVKKGLKLESDAIAEKIKMREDEISKLEDDAKKTGKIDEKKYSDQLEALKAYRSRLKQLDPKTDLATPSRNFLGTGGEVPDFGQLAFDAGQLIMPITGVKTLLGVDILPTTEAIGEGFKEIEYAIEDGVVAGLSVASHLLQKMGNDDAKALAEALDSVATIAANIGLASSGNPAAIASVAIAGIDLIANAWDQLWGKQSKAQKKAAEEARRAEEERLKAVRALEREYEAKFYSDIERLEKERDERVAYARSIGADVLNIERYYAGEIAKVRTKSSGVLVEEAEVEAEAKKIYDKYYALAVKMAKDFNDRFSGTAFITAEQILDTGELGDQMRLELADVEENLILYKSRYSEAFDGIGSAISTGLKGGLDEFDIKDSIMNLLKNMAIDAATIASGFKEKFKEIGVAVADALKDGFFSSDELSSISSLADKLTTDALGVISPIDALFGNLGGQLASGLVVDVAGATNTSQNIISLTATGVLNVDGKSLGTVVFQNWDQVTQGAYGA